jgi:GxxExxY protein
MRQEAPFDERDEIFRIVGAAMEVHSNLHGGLLEPPYQDALEIEFGLRGIPFVREAMQPIYYKGTKLRSSYRPDFICFDGIVVELKALGNLGSVEEAQLLNYLRITRYRRGVLLNFGPKTLQHKRFILDLDDTHPEISL